MDVRDQLVKTGKVTRGRIGVTIQNVDAQLAESFGLDRPRGALVSSVLKDGPGEKAGLKPGDVILAVNGQHDRDVPRSCRPIIARMKPGTDAQLTVWRGGKEQKISRERRRSSTTSRSADREPQGRAGQESDEASRLGLAVRPLAAAGEAAGGDRGHAGRGAGRRARSRGGRAAGRHHPRRERQAVKTIDELQAAAKTAGKTVALLIQRERRADLRAAAPELSRFPKRGCDRVGARRRRLAFRAAVVYSAVPQT